MENPATWGRAEHVVQDVIKSHQKQRAEDEANGDFRAGLSLARQITDALRKERLLKTEHQDESMRRLLEGLSDMHKRYEVKSDSEFPLFICTHCGVPAPCDAMQVINDLEENVL